MSSNQPQRDHTTEMRDFAVLWAKAQSNVTAYVRAAIRNAHDAEDVVQQVAMAAAQDFDRFDRDRSFVGWVIGIARFRILKHLQKESRDRHVFGDSTLQSLADAQIDIAPEIDDRREAIRKCMDKLQPRGRKVVEMRYLRSLKPAAIADQMGSTANAVSSLLSRIRSALANCVSRQLQSMEKSS